MADQGKDAEFPAEGPVAVDTAGRPTGSAAHSSSGARHQGAAPADLTDARSGLSEHTRNRIAAQLRAMYETVAQQPVPDRFAELIAKLDGGKA